MAVIRTRVSFAAILAAVMFAAAPSGAAVWPGEWLFSGGYGGFSDHLHADVPTLNPGENISARLSGSAMLSGQLIYQLTPRIGFGMQFIRRTENGVSYSPIGNQNVPTSTDNDFILATARYVFTPERTWNPYVVGGAGVDSLTINSSGFQIESLGSYATSVHVAALPFACSAGFGLERSLANHFFADVELGMVGVQSYTNAASQVRLPTEVMPYLTARLGFDLGGAGR